MCLLTQWITADVITSQNKRPLRDAFPAWTPDTIWLKNVSGSPAAPKPKLLPLNCMCRHKVLSKFSIGPHDRSIAQICFYVITEQEPETLISSQSLSIVLLLDNFNCLKCNVIVHLWNFSIIKCCFSNGLPSVFIDIDNGFHTGGNFNVLNTFICCLK